MTPLAPGLVLRVAAEANLAPSVHNTQATRWRVEGPRALGLHMDPARRLPVGDPEGRDAGVGAGAALEATIIALAGEGLAVLAVEPGEGDAVGLLRLGEGAGPDPRAGALRRRATWRGGFAPVPAATARALGRLCADAGVVLVPGPASDLAALGDAGSLALLRDRPYREELRAWMRLHPGERGWGRDGLDAPALSLRAWEARAAGLVLARAPFAALDALRLAGPLLGERAKTETAAALLLVHRPAEEPPVSSGRALMRLWLALTDLGLAAWPLAALADEPGARAEVARRHGVPDDRRLLTVLRVGLARGTAPRARLPAEALVLPPATGA